MGVRKPQVRYAWRPDTTVVNGVRLKPIFEVTWSLYGANGEYMCGSGSEGYRDKTDAKRAVDAVIAAFGFDSRLARVFGCWREIGPGRKPT